MNIESLFSFLDHKKIKYLKNELMKNHTTFKIGGPCDAYIFVLNVDELKEVISTADHYSVPYLVVGNGSNLLVSDKGIDGIIIDISNFDSIKADGDIITCGAGIKLSKLCKTALENSLTGLEFAYGIPGSVGGALFMNAGAYGGDMSDIVQSAKYIDKNGNVTELLKADMALGYRTSIFKKNAGIIFEVSFKLKKGDCTLIESRMNELMSRRKEKQPLEYPSAGSTFKRPENNFAGSLIEQNNLKGCSVGGAMVSQKHAGFVINYNNATCEDVKNLISKIQETVSLNNGINLETEILFIGRN